jgi:hypothetical protein
VAVHRGKSADADINNEQPKLKALIPFSPFTKTKTKTAGRRKKYTWASERYSNIYDKYKEWEIHRVQ